MKNLFNKFKETVSRGFSKVKTALTPKKVLDKQFKKAQDKANKERLKELTNLPDSTKKAAESMNVPFTFDRPASSYKSKMDMSKRIEIMKELPGISADVRNKVDNFIANMSKGFEGNEGFTSFADELYNLPIDAQLDFISDNQEAIEENYLSYKTGEITDQEVTGMFMDYKNSLRNYS